MIPGTPKPECGILKVSRKPVDDDGIPFLIDNVPDFRDHALQAHRGQSAFKHGILDPLPILFAKIGQPPEPGRPGPPGIGDIVGHKDIHSASDQDEGRIGWQVAAQMPGQ